MSLQAGTMPVRARAIASPACSTRERANKRAKRGGCIYDLHDGWDEAGFVVGCEIQLIRSLPLPVAELARIQLRQPPPHPGAWVGTRRIQAVGQGPVSPPSSSI